MTIKNQIEALIGLLDDTDDFVFQEVSKKLINLGEEIIPELERVWELSSNEFFQERIEIIIHKIQYNFVKENFQKWAETPEQELLEGAFLVAKLQYPNLSFDKILKKIEPIINNTWLEINDNLTALEKVKILNHIMFSIHKFTRNSSNLTSPENFYINFVLDEKKGNPVSIALVYAIVAQRLGIPIYGVNLPKNFILAYKSEIPIIDDSGELDNDILFYINPFNKGFVFGRREIDQFITQQKLEFHESYYTACSNKEIIKLIIESLIISYEQLGYADKVEELSSLLEIVR